MSRINSDSSFDHIFDDDTGADGNYTHISDETQHIDNIDPFDCDVNSIGSHISFSGLSF